MARGAQVDVAVVGAGVVGLAIAFGLSGRRLRVAVVDGEGETRPASLANFGLVWVQSKPLLGPDYGLWTIASARAWPSLCCRVAGGKRHRCRAAPGGRLYAVLEGG
ncbi:MAG: FAD-dependent oxidoreductase [Acetobacteraceae bacterium]|nr:FAD-dependent oxidoreductase [Acetobacteraceae bacterium]